ncbi:MAG: methylmalonyl-CoA carboxyltransferase [Alphaproteobacteria bacterium]|nr:methylmalonyl-CoA carboxyltransferase [Alphaproteobacteria bacterium]
MDRATLKELDERRRAGRREGTHAGTAKSASPGKLSARQRIALLLDPGSFQEIGVLARSQHRSLRERTPADGLVAGAGTIDGREVFLVAEDADVLAGTRGLVAEAKAQRVRELALRHARPFIALMEAGAGRFQEVNGATAAGLGRRFIEHFRLSGRVPQVAAFMGACFGGPSFTGAQSDFITIVEGTGFMGMSGPPVVKVGLGLEVSREEIGSARMSAIVTGQADHLAADEAEALRAIRRYLSFLPSNCNEPPPRVPSRPAEVDTPAGKARIDALVPENLRRAYSMARVLQMIVDDGELFEYRALYGQSMITAFARIDGRAVGLIANNPMQQAGAIGHEAARKMRKFAEICDAFHLPLVFFCDCPGFLVGPDLEQQRMISLASRLLNTLIGLSVPRVTIVARKAIGLAYIAMCGKAMAPDAIAAWPTSFFDAMGPAAGVELVHARAIANSDEPDRLRASLLANVLSEGSGHLAAERAIIDDIIRPSETRAFIVDALARSDGRGAPGFRHRIDP